MRKYLTFGLLFSAFLFFTFSGVSLAQTPPKGVPCKPAVPCEAGPYQLNVSFNADTFNTTGEFLATVERLKSQDGNWKLGVEIVPDRSTSATPVKFEGSFETEISVKRTIKIYFPIAGSWSLHLSISGPEGPAQFLVPVKVQPPPKLDDWLAWVIGLSPILGILGFAFGQWRHVVYRKREEKLFQVRDLTEAEKAEVD